MAMNVDEMLKLGHERQVPKRIYKDGIEISVIGFGGIVLVNQEPKVGADDVAWAFDRGINYYDVARDQTRSTFMREIAQEWELPIPTAIDIPDIALGFVALSIGLELKFSHIKKLGTSIVYIILLESFGFSHFSILTTRVIIKSIIRLYTGGLSRKS